MKRNKSRSRSRSRHKYRRDSLSKERDRRERSRDRDRRDRSRDRRSRSRDRRHRSRDRRSRSRDRSSRRNYRFDSPPKLDAKKQFGLANYTAQSGLEGIGSKAFREIYIGNIPPVGDIEILMDIINQALISVNGTSMPGNPCLKGWISSDGHYAFIELRTMEEASNCMQLTGLNIMGHNIKVNRPKTYDADVFSKAPSPTVPTLDPSLLAMGVQALKSAKEQIAAASDILAAEKAKSITDRLCLVGIPKDMEQQTVVDLLQSQGTIKFTHFIMEKGEMVVLFEYENLEDQKSALESLPKQGYRVIMAIDAVTQGIISPQQIKTQLANCSLMKAEIPTRALLLSNLVSKEELDDDEEYVDIIDDIRCECELYGVVLRVELPRVPKGLSEEEMNSFDPTSVGSGFVLFSTVDSASKARKVLDGRKFGQRTVHAHFFSELYFLTGRFGNPKPNFEKEHSSIYTTELVNNPNIAPDILNKLETNHKTNDTT
ncbi:snrnp splicing factor (U2AF), putative [Theileria annulata]|uniref:Snrnp splicing factor (U2AF), putative n=1 Tax=Theileria annulata TaxID=5874 RepID=Q4UCN0_THEAN|nr:snrnp splicing factor (U2AF), putative [Theileria annulata]CAI75421.1 snrnp splicing factor (U2AF), putative [Theileria annulata]|eukprot:XP_954897.1 snrnp splicing factor (U2AF), putative [Theileria annulata]